MYLGNRLNGRRERRLPIAVVVRLEALDGKGGEEHEQTYTDYLSAHGVRVKSTRLWHAGEQAQITSANQESAMRGEVVYCQKLEDARFFVGLKFLQGRITWPVFLRFDGI